MSFKCSVCGFECGALDHFHGRCSGDGKEDENGEPVPCKPIPENHGQTTRCISPKEGFIAKPTPMTADWCEHGKGWSLECAECKRHCLCGRLSDPPPVCPMHPRKPPTIDKEPKIGVKFDQGKIDWSLLPWDGLEPVVRVLEFGAEKYARDNWRKVPNSTARYRKALLRHVIAWCAGQENDPETGESHLAHAVCCGIFLLGKRELP